MRPRAGRPSPALVISASSSGPVQRASGTPVAASNAGQRDDRGAGQLADPPWPPGAGQISQPVQAAAGERPRHLRTVSTGDPQVRGDPRIVPAARGGQHDLRAQPVPVRRLSLPGRVCSSGTLAALSRTGTARCSGMAAPGQITVT